MVAQTGERLAAAIVDDPSDANLTVYGDWLQQTGDPHGEFCGLANAAANDPALAAKVETAIKKLRKRHGVHRGIAIEWRHGFADSITANVTDAGAWSAFMATGLARFARALQFPKNAGHLIAHGLPQALRSLVIKGNKVADLAPLATLRKLRVLVLDDTTKVIDLSPLSKCTALVEADLSGARAKDLSPLSALSLEVLTLPQNTVADLSPLAEITTLRSLSGYVKLVRDLSPIAKLPLTHLDLTHLDRTQLDVIAKLTKLEHLGIRWRTVTADLAPLANLTSLTSLQLNNTPILDLAPLAGLYNLRDLDLSTTGVSNVAPLANLVNLERLSLRFVRELSDITALHGLAKLKQLDVVYTSCNRQERARFEKAVPTCRISPNQNAD